MKQKQPPSQFSKISVLFFQEQPFNNFPGGSICSSNRHEFSRRETGTGSFHVENLGSRSVDWRSGTFLCRKVGSGTFARSRIGRAEQSEPSGPSYQETRLLFIFKQRSMRRAWKKREISFP